MEFVLLMPGQGSQKVGMAKDLFEAFPVAHDVLSSVNDAIEANLTSLMFEGPSDELTRTHNAQPALLAHSAAAWAIVRDALESNVVAAAGHSLGEFSAYHVAGALSVTDATKIVRRRGTLMFDEGVRRPGAMAAIVGVMNRSIDDICHQASAESAMVVPANYNSAEQVVISGETAGVDRAMQLAKEAGARRCLPLPVSGAFHSPLMSTASAGLREALDLATWSEPAFPIVANVDASFVRTSSAARPLLVQQLASPVQWTHVMQNLVAAYPQAVFVEVGTGSVLSGLARRIAPNVTTMQCGTVADIEKIMQTVTSTATQTVSEHAH